MYDWSFCNSVTESIPFHLKGYAGKVSIYYGVNDDPLKVGFDALPGLPFNLDACRGYPVIHARIEAYAGSGYRTLCGWIQIVTSVYLDARDGQPPRSETFVSADVAPAFDATDIPFATYGYLPQLFDAPCLNLGDYTKLRWTADTFLTTVPVRSRDEEISRLLGFRWGYLENDTPGEKPVLLPLKITDAQVWNQHLAYLREQYVSWRFKNA